MTTLGVLKARIADDLARGGELDTQIAAAIEDAVDYYKDEKFTFNQGVGTVTTASGTANYDLPVDAQKIDAATIVSSGSRYDLERIPFEQYLEYSQIPDTALGTPCEYAIWNNDVYFYPTPTAIETVTFWSVEDLTAFASDDDSNGWTTEGRMLIRCHAKGSIYRHVIRNFEEAAANESAALVELRRLRRKANRLLSRGQVRPSIT